MKKKDFKPGEWVEFDGKTCQVFRHKTEGLALRIAMPGGWYKFQPLDWNDVSKIQKPEQ